MQWQNLRKESPTQWQRQDGYNCYLNSILSIFLTEYLTNDLCNEWSQHTNQCVTQVYPKIKPSVKQFQTPMCSWQLLHCLSPTRWKPQFLIACLQTGLSAVERSMFTCNWFSRQTSTIVYWKILLLKQFPDQTLHHPQPSPSPPSTQVTSYIYN